MPEFKLQDGMLEGSLPPCGSIGMKAFVEFSKRAASFALINDLDLASGAQLISWDLEGVKFRWNTTEATGTLAKLRRQHRERSGEQDA